MRKIILALALILSAAIPALAQTVPNGPRFVLPFQTVIDGTGVPLPGAQLFFYQSGTNTPLNTYSNSSLTVPNTNPVVASAAGVFPNIFLSGLYKVVLEDSSGNQIWSADPVDGTQGGSAGGKVTFAGDVYFKSGRPWADVMAWGALCGGNDDHVAYQNAINMLESTYGGGTLFVPPCVSSTTATITLSGNVRWVGSGPNISYIQNTGLDAIFIEFTGNYAALEHFGVFGKVTASPSQPLVLVAGNANGSAGVNDNIDDVIIYGGATGLSESNSADGTISRSFISCGSACAAVTSTGANHYIRDKFDDVTNAPKLAAFAQNTSGFGAGIIVENQFIDCDFSGTYTDSVLISDTNNEATTIFEAAVFSSPISVTAARYTIISASEIGGNISTAANMSIAGSYGLTSITVSGAGTRSCAANSNITC